jgi:hypothetical protein
VSGESGMRIDEAVYEDEIDAARSREATEALKLGSETFEKA